MIKLKNILEFHHGKAPSAKDPKKDGNKKVYQGKGYRVTLNKDKNYTEKGVYQATYKDNPGLSKEKAKSIASRIHKSMNENIDEPQGTVHEVIVKNYEYVPKDITINQGDSVKFINKQGIHNVNAETSHPRNENNPSGFKNSLGKQWEYTVKFFKPGTYNYHCDPHLSMDMVGTVNVTEAVEENTAPNHDGKAAPYGSGYEKVEEISEVRGGLGKWFREKWVDVSRKTKSGKHPKCGASAGKKSRAGGKRAYPKCVPASKAKSMSKKDKASATRRKRAAYKSKKGAPSKKPKNVSTEALQEIGRLIEKNNPTQPSKWAYAKSQAKKKFKVYPSAYANAWAAKKYKELGGGWRKGK